MERNIATLALAVLLLAASLTDMRTRRIPDALSVTTIAAGVAATVLLRMDLAASIIGAVAGYFAIVLTNWAFRRVKGRDGVGLGDAKLLAGIGAWATWTGLPFVVLIAAACGLAYAALRRVPPQGEIVFGPFLATGGFIVWLTLVYYSANA
jgi:prepilin signal peptidase PulO-like enzyme (type II secretory pathway)